MSVSPVSTAEGRADSRPPQAPATVADVVQQATKTVAEGDHAAAATYLMRHASATALVVMDFQAGKRQRSSPRLTSPARRPGARTSTRFTSMTC